MRNRYRLDVLREDAGIEPLLLRQAMEMVEETRRRFVLNVTEDLACEALAYRLEQLLLPLSEPGRVFLPAPRGADQTEFLALMTASEVFHARWASAPTDPERFAAFLADGERADFEAMLICRHEDGAILGFFNPLADRPPFAAKCLPRLRGGSAGRRPRLHA